MVKYLCACLFLLIQVNSQAAELRVSVDREKLFEDESLVMNVQLIDGDTATEFDPVLNDFEILQRSQGSQTQIINGERTDSLSWEFLLAPRSAGKLIIPAFELGGTKSNEIEISVENLAASGQSAEERPFFLRVSVSNKEPFVQQQVIYTMKLYQQQTIVDGNVTEPDHEDVQIERLGLDRSYIEVVDGREFSVLERRYALFPQRSGEIVLPPINLNARVQIGQRSNRFFSPNVRNIRVRAQSIKLQVQPATSEYSAAWWLASTNVIGEAKWVPQNAQLGQPLTLEVHIAAEGVMPSQIPLMDEPVVEGVRIYSDGSRAAKKAGTDGVVSQRVSRWTIIPVRPGELRVDSFMLPWWDLATSSQKVLEVIVPPLPITGTLAPNGLQEPAPDAKPVAEPVLADQERSEPRATESPEETTEAIRPIGWWLRDWRTLVVLISVVAFATLVIRRRRRRPLPLQTDEQLCSPDAAMVRLVEAVTRADIKVARNAMLDWGTGTFRREIRSLPELAENLQDPEFAQLVKELDVVCYRDKTRWYGEPLQEKVKAYKPPQIVVVEQEQLPPLS